MSTEISRYSRGDQPSSGLTRTEVSREDAPPEAQVPVVCIVMERNTRVLGGQEVRWGRLIQGLADQHELNVRILCTSSLVEAWRAGEVGEVGANVSVFAERHSKLHTWLGAQIFVWRHLPRGSVVQLTTLGLIATPAALFAKYAKGCTLVKTLTQPRFAIEKAFRFRRKNYWVSLISVKLADFVDALNPKIGIDDVTDGRKLSVSPCSFSDPERFRPAARKLRRVVFAAHFFDIKGAEILIDIVKHWPANGNAELVLCGSGPYEAALRAAATGKRGVSIERRWIMSEVLGEASVFLSLQVVENYPSQSLLEAMLAGCFILATDVGDTDLLVREPWGRRFPLETSGEEYVRAIFEALDAPYEVRATAGAAGRDFIMRTHTRDRYIEYLVSLWKRAARHQLARRTGSSRMDSRDTAGRLPPSTR